MTMEQCTKGLHAALANSGRTCWKRSTALPSSESQNSKVDPLLIYTYYPEPTTYDDEATREEALNRVCFEKIQAIGTALNH